MEQSKQMMQEFANAILLAHQTYRDSWNPYAGKHEEYLSDCIEDACRMVKLDSSFINVIYILLSDSRDRALLWAKRTTEQFEQKPKQEGLS